jgi:hypothetical protein
VARLAIDGNEIDHIETGDWPEPERLLRVFWFSVESANLGGRLEPENAGERLQYRTFLAPEMGQGLRAERLPDSHNDDHIGEQTTAAPVEAGTVRLYARIEVVEALSDLRPLQALTTRGVDAVLDPDFPVISRSADFGGAAHESTGELFGLPGFEPMSQTGDWNEVTVPAFGKTFTDLVSERFVVSSRTLASVALRGTPDAGRPDGRTGVFTSLGELQVMTDRVERQGRTLRWQNDVFAGDLLVDGDHWRVLLADDGNGVLDPADTVLHCWGRPPARTTLWATLEAEALTAEHLRYED